jgi:fructose/tagatose bisphosphate aldolase
VGEAKHATRCGSLDASLYTQPEDVFDVYAALSPISQYFSIAVGFGNTHGMYKPGTIQLKPSLLGNYQSYVQEKVGHPSLKPVFLVFHGGSGSTTEEFEEAIGHGVVKVNVNADVQFAMMTGVKDFMFDKKDVSCSGWSIDPFLVWAGSSNSFSTSQLALVILRDLMSRTRSTMILDTGYVKVRREWLNVSKSILTVLARRGDFDPLWLAQARNGKSFQ